ncbi:hypothetical protein KUCAC02_012812, partial [Chaenocephalus aceratus]
TVFSLSTRSYPACSSPGSTVLHSILPVYALRVASAAPPSCLPLQSSFRPRSFLHHQLQVTMSLDGSFTNDSTHTHTEMQLTSRSSMLNNTQSHAHRR